MKLSFQEKPEAETVIQPTEKGCRKSRKKTVVFSLVGLVMVAAAALACKYFLFTEAAATVLTGTTTYGSLAQTIEGTGITTPADSYTDSTASDTEILEVAVSAGDTVRKGDLLYIQDDSEIDTSIEAYQEEITTNQDNIADYEEQLADLREEMAGLTITAPLSGHLSDVKVEAGDTVKAGDVLCTLVDDSHMTLTQYFSYAYEDQIYEGMSAVISIPDLMTSRNGAVTEVRKVERVTADIDGKVMMVMVRMGAPLASAGRRWRSMISPP